MLATALQAANRLEAPWGRLCRISNELQLGVGFRCAGRSLKSGMKEIPMREYGNRGTGKETPRPALLVHLPTNDLRAHTITEKGTISSSFNSASITPA